MRFKSRLYIAAAVAITYACASAPPPQAPAAPDTRRSRTGVALTADMIGRQYGSIALSGVADDPAYGYSERSPIKVGGGFGSKNHYAFLNSLAGPNGEKLAYERVGSCCAFDAPNSPFGQGVLEVFTVSYAGGAEARSIYFDWYNEDPLLVPVGLTAKK